jgi:HEAT repeat protein
VSVAHGSIVVRVALSFAMFAGTAGSATALQLERADDRTDVQAPERSAAERVQRILTDVSLDPGLAVEVAGQELLTLPGDALPAIFDALCGVVESSAPVQNEDGAPTNRTEAALLYALEHTPSARLAPLFESQTTAEGSVRGRLAALRILTEIASARDFRLICRLASTEPMDPSVERALETTVDALLRRDQAIYTVLERAYPTSVIALRRAFIRAVSRTPTLDGLRLLSRVLYRDEELRPLLLVTIGRLSNDLPRPIGDDVLSNVRRFLIEADPVALPEAILAVGYLDDCESIPQLIALLKCPRRGLRANALWSLKRITGLGIAETPERWTSWYQSEREWWQNVWPSKLAALRGVQSGRTKSALVEIGTRHLFRHALAAQVAELVTHQDPDVVTLACTTLAQLESRAAIPGLIGVLDHDDAIVRLAAWNALRAITKKDLPPDAVAWSAAKLGS